MCESFQVMSKTIFTKTSNFARVAPSFKQFQGGKNPKQKLGIMAAKISNIHGCIRPHKKKKNEGDKSLTLLHVAGPNFESI